MTGTKGESAMRSIRLAILVGMLGASVFAWVPVVDVYSRPVQSIPTDVVGPGAGCYRAATPTRFHWAAAIADRRGTCPTAAE
jgi:hypothetical protein